MLDERAAVASACFWDGTGVMMDLLYYGRFCIQSLTLSYSTAWPVAFERTSALCRCTYCCVDYRKSSWSALRLPSYDVSAFSV